MKRLKENMNGLLICLFELVIGIILLIDPVEFTSGIIIAAGIVLIILGIISCIKYIKTDILKASKGQFLTKGLISILMSVCHNGGVMGIHWCFFDYRSCF